MIERHIYPNEVNEADEVFITGSAVEVAVVSQIGNHSFEVGKTTEAIISAYNTLVRGEDV